jgi:hypothetical protein
VFDIVTELLGAGLGEIHAVISAQPARLSFEIRPVLDIAPLIVNEAVPDIDIGDTGFNGSSAIKLV